MLMVLLGKDCHDDFIPSMLHPSVRILGQIVLEAEEGACILDVQFCILGHGHGGSYRPHRDRSLIFEEVHLVAGEPNVASVLAAG